MKRRNDPNPSSPLPAAPPAAVVLALLALTASCGDAPSTGAGAIGPASTLERN